jgi:hypothetical protein
MREFSLRSDEPNHLLEKYIARREIDAWLGSPPNAFGKRTPRELIRDRKIGHLILEFESLETGEPL